MARLRGARYCIDADPTSVGLQTFIAEELAYLDYPETLAFYDKLTEEIMAVPPPKRKLWNLALLGCNDRYYLLTGLLGRRDALHPWLFDRCREVERNPDGYIDLWARFHYKSTIITLAGCIQEIMCDPEITIAIFSAVKPIASAFLTQIKEEFENNEFLKAVYPDALYRNPRGKGPDGRPAKWGAARGLTVKRKTNPKEATVEAHGLIDGQPTSRHFRLHVYEDVVTQDYLSEDLIKKTIQRWEMADNLGTKEGARKWMPGTRYHYADLGGVVVERKSLKPRIYPATDDGTLNGKPVFLSPERWAQIKNDQRSTIAAQMLQNPLAGTEATFNTTWFTQYEVIPAVLNIYILCDPSKGSGQRSDRTAIIVIGVDQGGSKYLLDGVRHRMKLTDRWAYIKQLRRKWLNHKDVTVQDVRVGYEQYGMLSDIEVMKDFMEREGEYFEIVELNTPKQGGHSKKDRVERLEPDIREGRFHLPCVIYYKEHHPEPADCYWSVWTKEHEKLAAEKGIKHDYHLEQVLYRAFQGPTKRMQQVRPERVVKPLRRRDENGEVYDVTRAFIDEARQHPFGTHDDLIDVASRIYDIDPHAPVAYERQSTEPLDIEGGPLEMEG